MFCLEDWGGGLGPWAPLGYATVRLWDAVTRCVFCQVPGSKQGEICVQNMQLKS